MPGKKMRQRQIHYDFIYMWNLKKSKLIDTENRLVVAKRQGVGVVRLGEIG